MILINVTILHIFVWRIQVAGVELKVLVIYFDLGMKPRISDVSALTPFMKNIV